MDFHKKCVKCGKDKPLTSFYRNKTYTGGYMNSCKECKDSYDKERTMTWGREKRLKNQKDYKTRLRRKFLDAYGGACACCGEDREEFLELDHINGGGYQHRKSTKKDMYSVVRQEGYPKDRYRILCANCNHSLGMKGYCPHQK